MAATTTLAQGSSVTLTVTATDSLLIDSAAAAQARIEAVSGVAGSANRQVIAFHPGGQRTYGPFGTGDIKLSAVTGAIQYIQGQAPLTDELSYFGAVAYTWANLPSASSMVGAVFVTDVGTHGSLWYSDGTTWGLANGSCVLAQSAVAVSVSASTSEESLFSIAIPAGLLGLSGALRLSMLWTTTSSANNKTLRARLGSTALGGSAWFALVNTTTASTQIPAHTLRSRNSASSQVCFPAANGSVGTQSGTAVSTFTEDTSVATVFALTGQKATAGEVLTLEGFTLELLRP